MAFNLDNSKLFEALFEPEELEAISEAVSSSPFENLPKSFIHDWRRYLPDELAVVWLDLSEETRLVAYYLCRKQANNEEWE